MKSINARRIIDKILSDLEANGIAPAVNIPDLQELRKYAKEDQDPTVVKVLRLTYEHLEQYGTFHIPIPADEDEEEEENEEEVVEPEVVDESIDEKQESFAYLVSLFSNPRNKINRSEIIAYRDALGTYGK